MLHDRYAGGQQHCMRRASAGGRVVDVDRVDPDQHGATLNEGVRAGLGQVRMNGVAVTVRAPVAIPARSQQYGTAFEGNVIERVGTDRAVTSTTTVGSEAQRSSVSPERSWPARKR
jgi:hypothetical protein